MRYLWSGWVLLALVIVLQLAALAAGVVSDGAGRAVSALWGCVAVLFVVKLIVLAWGVVTRR